MILSYEVEDENLTPFEKFFLFEAPLEKPKRKNVKVIKVRGGSRGKDYTQVDDEDESQEDSSEDTNNNTSDEDTENSEDESEGEEDNKDYTSDDDNDESDDNSSDEEDSDDEESEDNKDYTSDDDSDGSDDSDDSGDDSQDESEGEEDNKDYTSDGGDDDDNDDSSDDDSNNNSDDSSSEDEKNNKIEKLRKFNLFKDFIKLRGTLETYIEKLDSVVSDNNEINSLYKNVTNRFRTLNELIYDYMVIKFERNTYFKSFIFYQRVIATMQFNIDLLGKVKKKEQSLGKSKNNRLK